MKKEKLKIIYEDKELLVVYKKGGLLTISSEKEKENTLFHKVYEYEKAKNKNNKVFIIHRLDKDTSGLVIFAKSEKTKRFMQDNWNTFTRKYIAVVSGKMDKKEYSLISYLMETKTNLVYVTKNEKLGKKAITNYKVIGENKNYSLLDIDIKTGRKNQIRVQLSNINHPILGDKKYSKLKTNPLSRLCLEAYFLKIIHPITKKEMDFVIPMNKDFINLCK